MQPHPHTGSCKAGTQYKTPLSHSPSFQVCLLAPEEGRVTTITQPTARAPAEWLGAPQAGPATGGPVVKSQVKTSPNEPVVQGQHTAPESLLHCPVSAVTLVLTPSTSLPLQGHPSNRASVLLLQGTNLSHSQQRRAFLRQAISGSLTVINAELQSILAECF